MKKAMIVLMFVFASEPLFFLILQTMKHFWALPAFLRLAIASQHHFNVLEDLHANPQVKTLEAV